MKRKSGLVCAAVCVAMLAMTPAGRAGASTGDSQRFDGLIIASGRSGARVVVATVVRARGVFDGVGHVVEIDNFPGDPDNVNRDDLVFKQGVMHLRNEILSVAFDVNPRSCVFTADIDQHNVVEGGTGRFAHASGGFVGHVHARGVAPRDATGTCDAASAPLFEADAFTGTGQLSL